jgi:hypothetical protein
MRTFAAPTFLSSNSSKMGTSEGQSVGTDKQLRIEPFLCVSYEREEGFYQPLRLVNTVFVGPMLMAASTKVDNPLLKGVTGLSGLFLMVSNGIRFYEAYEEMARYTAEIEGTAE